MTYPQETPSRHTILIFKTCLQETFIFQDVYSRDSFKTHDPDIQEVYSRDIHFSRHILKRHLQDVYSRDIRFSRRILKRHLQDTYLCFQDTTRNLPRGCIILNWCPAEFEWRVYVVVRGRDSANSSAELNILTTSNSIQFQCRILFKSNTKSYLISTPNSIQFQRQIPIQS